MFEPGEHKVSQREPRLWVETLWLLESLACEGPVREIPFRPGLNLVVSPPGSGSQGHGVGKTAFCQLLRFVLDDPHWSDGSTLRDELLQSEDLKEGAVAARVHVGSEAWTVLKPWRHQRHYRASRTADWRRLASNEADNEFEAYQAALQKHLVGILPVQNLPGSKQPIQWHHILAWCSRDQNARYQNFFQWRAEGVGFSLPAKSPVALMRIVLGLLHDAKTLRELDRVTKEVKDLDSKQLALRAQAQYLMENARRQLNRHLGTSSAVPFRQDGLIKHPNLIAVARQRLEAYQQELHAIEFNRQKLAAEREALIERRAPLKGAMDLLANEIAQHEAYSVGDLKRVEELQNEASSLKQRLPSWCDAGHRQLKDCHHVNERIKLTQIDRVRRIAQHRQASSSRENALEALRHRLNELEDEATPYNARLSEIETSITGLDGRCAQALLADELLRRAIEDYEQYEAIVSGISASAETAAADRALAIAKGRLGALRMSHAEERSAMGTRRRAISETMDAVARALPGFGWGVFNDDEKHQSHPFRMGPMHSTTFSVLEILAGDIACLLDCESTQSFHPGFLLHDSPREAEMSEAILWHLLGHVVSFESGAFQYVVTTSTEPAAGFEPFVRLRLSADGDDAHLFRRRFGGILQEIE